jgi:hypothetical protein
MKMRIIKLFGLSVLSSVLLFISCSKSGTTVADDDGPHVYVPTDSIAPVLEIYTPVQNQEFANGSSVSITGKISDDLGLYRGSVKMVNDANGSVLLNQAYEIHGLLQYNFNLNQAASVTAQTVYTITVSFEDHGYNSVTKSVKIKVNP